MNPDDLVRLRADPSKVRVSVRRRTGWWIVTITSLVTGADVSVYRAVVTGVPICQTAAMIGVALEHALQRAYDSGIPGIDPGCQWAYHHPQFIPCQTT